MGSGFEPLAPHQACVRSRLILDESGSAVAWSLGRSFMTSLLVWKLLIEDARGQRAAVPPNGSISPGLVRSGRRRL